MLRTARGFPGASRLFEQPYCAFRKDTEDHFANKKHTHLGRVCFCFFPGGGGGGDLVDSGGQQSDSPMVDSMNVVTMNGQKAEGKGGLDSMTSREDVADESLGRGRLGSIRFG